MEERWIAGLSCRDVLAKLTEYFDGELAPPERAKIEAHVAGCDQCARFGGSFATAVQALRERLRDAQRVPSDVAQRLQERMRGLFRAKDDPPPSV